MKSHLLPTCAALLIASAMSPAHASTIVPQTANLTLTGWAYGNSWGNVVDAQSSHDAAAHDNGAAGGFTGSVTFVGSGAFAGTIDGFVTYCVELTETFSFSPDAVAYQVLPGGAYTEWDDANANGRTAAQTATRLGQLLSYVADHALVQTAAQSTSLQLAIWNVVYDTDDSVGSGTFRDASGSAYDAYANALLQGSAAWSQMLDVYVLTRSNRQDFVLTGGVDHAAPPGDNASSVPEPGSLSLAAVALGGAALLARRRRR